MKNILMHPGLANLHNAHRASSPVVNIIGGMATWHNAADPLLAMPIETLSSTLSNFTRTSTAANHLAADTSAAICAAKLPAEAGASRIATLIVPHDLAWSETLPMSSVSADESIVLFDVRPFLAACAAALKAEPRGKAALYLGGSAVLEKGTQITNCG